MSDSAGPLIDVVIPNWNGRAMLQMCLKSLERQTYQNFQVTVVDNGSLDGSAAFLREHHPHIRLICLPENRGFSAAVNEGIRQSAAPWVLLLNNDIEVESSCLKKCAEQIGRDDGYDFYALKMIDFHNRDYLDGAGDGVLRGGVGYRLGTMEQDSEAYNLRREVFGACGGAALYSRALFTRIGLFDEDFFAYLEDVDFNMRALREGGRCCYLPEAVVYHIGSATSGSKINAFTVTLTTRNNMYVLAKNYSLVLFLRFLPAIAVYQFFWLLFVLKKGQFIAYLKGLGQSLPRLPAMVRRGRATREQTALSDRAFAAAIVQSERSVIYSIMNRRRQQSKSNSLLEIYLRLFC